ncbi:methylated-DNA--[protein]-cysteine S-methyltransferase [Brevundimonas sp. 2R-24]|uniref:Methylated-DNA--[protein]-cysteine S-methyltransferase n=1 Tax=Peiella sedimenti TaxID=3061083 RepID=A0ABT8SLQ1_9CAUL|nr:methylated-DNA--[protein]-cysteine S-methyltransferase [Caulobacteraceae bacterium XZ-24]
MTSPIGLLTLACDEAGALRALSFGQGAQAVARRRYPHAEQWQGETPGPVREALEAYFGGDRGALARAPWAVEGDGFSERVWRLLTQIPAGQVWSYGEMAARAASSEARPDGRFVSAARAAGAALNANPLPLVLPCHRVVGADGALTGFGGGLEIKRWLLIHEGALLI